MPGGQQALISQGIPGATSLSVFPGSYRMVLPWLGPLALPKTSPPHPDLPLCREQTCQRALLFLLLWEGISGYKLYTDEVSSRYADSCFQFSLALISNIKQSRPTLPVSTLLPSPASHFILVLRVIFLSCCTPQLSGCLGVGDQGELSSPQIQLTPTTSWVVATLHPFSRYGG